MGYDRGRTQRRFKNYQLVLHKSNHKPFPSRNPPQSFVGGHLYKGFPVGATRLVFRKVNCRYIKWTKYSMDLESNGTKRMVDANLPSAFSPKFIPSFCNRMHQWSCGEEKMRAHECWLGWKKVLRSCSFYHHFLAMHMTASQKGWWSGGRCGRTIRQSLRARLQRNPFERGALCANLTTIWYFEKKVASVSFHTHTTTALDQKFEK